MLNDIEEHVKDLYDNLTTQNCDSICRSLISDINLKCGEVISQQTIVFCLSVFFTKDKNILAFLRRSIAKDELKATKVELLQFLYRFITAADKLILPHANDILSTCMNIFNSDKYSDVRCSIIPIIAKLLELTSQKSELTCKIDIKKITDDFYLALGTPSKLSSSIKANILSMLGLMCQYYPVEMLPESNKILEALISNLKNEMGSRVNHKPDNTVISGTLEGLNSYLINFTHSAQEGGKYSYQIFKFIKDALNENKDLNRFSMPKAALNLLTRHAEQFDEYLFDDFEAVFKRITYWVSHKNYEIKRFAYFALDSFYKQLAEMLQRKCKSEPVKSRAIFNFFIKKFIESLSRSVSDSNIKETVVAIKGYGSFASPCKEFLTNDDVKRMLTIIIERCEQIYFYNKSSQDYLFSQDLFDEKVYQLPSFIDSLSLICDQIDGKLPEGCLLTIEKLVILAIDCYPKLFKRYNTQLFLAIAKILVSLQFNKKIDEFAPRIVYHSLIRIFSYKTNYNIQQDENQQDDGLDSSIKSIEFIDFWSNMFTLNKFDEFKTTTITIEQRKQLTKIVYDEFVDALLKITKKLDFSSIKEQQEDNNLQEDFLEYQTSKPTKPRDFEILVNLVDFAKEILLNHHIQSFEKWLARFSKEVILLSENFPLISGFYKLNTICLKIAVRINYFEIDRDSQENYRIEKDACLELFKKYSNDVVVRLKQFKDELLVSSLEYVLSQPKQLIELNLIQAFNSLENALELGLNYLPIAKTALDSLEYWIKSIEISNLKPHFSNVLLKFDDYLQISSSKETLDESKKINNSKKSRSLRTKLINKSIKKTIKINNDKDINLIDDIQFRILKIIGQNAGEMSVCLYKSNVTEDIISWDTFEHLKFSVPFIDIKPTIYFDKFLPRIIYLALSSTNRQIKVNACELLHAIVVYTIGKNVSDPLSKTSNSIHHMTNIYSHIYPALFRLACDVDQFVRNLFQPLVMQIIHWFTGNRTYENKDTIVLLDCIFECLVDEKDALLREFSAVALKEFFKWSLKHTSAAQQDEEKSQINAKSILKRIFNLITHPSSIRRLGAAHAWNSIYVIFREEALLVDKYIFELLYYFVEGLATAQRDDKMSGTQEQTKIALDHIERIISVKKDLLNQINPKRIKPFGWTEAVVEVAVRWLVRQCGRIQVECRHKAMELVVKLAPCIKNIKSTKEYFLKKLESGDNGFEVYFIERFEGSINKQSLSSYPCIGDILVEQTDSPTKVNLWLDMFIAPLDCYTWVFSESLLTPSNVFSRGKSTIWTSIKNFIDKVAMSSLDVLSNANQVSIKEKQEFDRLKCTAIVRLLDFLSCVISKYSVLNELETGCYIRNLDVFNEMFLKLLIMICLNPENLGFKISDIEIFQNLPQMALNFLKLFITLINTTPIEIKFKKCCIYLIDEISEIPKIESYLMENDEKSIDWIHLSQLVGGYDALHKLKIYDFQLQSAQKLFEKIRKTVGSNDQKSIVILEAKSKIVDIILASNEDFITQILDEVLVENKSDCKEFVRVFRNDIYTRILKSDKIYNFIFSRLNLAFDNVLKLLIQLVDFIHSEKLFRKLYAQKLVNNLSCKWIQINTYLSTSTDIENKILTLNLLTKILLIVDPNNHNFIQNAALFEFYTSLLLDTETKLSFKCKILDLLPYFSTLDNHEKFSIKQPLEKFISLFFPLSSKELDNFEEALNDYINAIKKILVATELSLSFDLCQVIIGLFIRESDHALDEDVKQLILNYSRRIEPKKQTNWIKFYWEKYFMTSQLAFHERKCNLFEKFFCTFIQNCHKSVFIEFVHTNLIQIIKITDLELLHNDPNINVPLDERRFAYTILEMIFRRCTKEEVFSPHSKICQIYETHKFGIVKDGKEFVKELIRKTRKQLTEAIKLPHDGTAAESLRILNCAAYNCLVELFIRTQTEPKLYNACLFKDDASKNEFIFEPLIDKNKVYKFNVEISDSLQRKTKLILLRNEFKENSEIGEGTANYIASLSDSTIQQNQSVFASSQNLYGSSLSEELSAFDYTSHSRIQSQSLNTLSRKSSNIKRIDENDKQQLVDDQMELEMDDLNRHECMETLIRLIQSLVKNKITPIYDDSQSPTELPPWMQFLNRKLCSLTTHENIKLFIIRGILNTNQVFTKYAKFWYNALISFLAESPSLCKDCTIDYFTLDLLVLLLSWHKISLPEINEKEAVNQIYIKLIKNCYNDNRSILKNNLELIKATTECWKHLIEVPVDEINNLLRKDEMKKISSGIQIFGFCLSNNISNYNYPSGMNYQEFYKTLLDLCTHKSKLIHAPASEILGMLMEQLNKNAFKSEELENTLKYYLRIIAPTPTSILILSIYRVQLTYPQILENFIGKLVFLLPQLVGEFKLMCAESILSSIKLLEDPIWKRGYFIEMLSHRDAQLQLVSLRIINELLEKINKDDVIKIIDILCDFINHPNVQCRYQVTLILISLYNIYEQTKEERIFNKCQNSLLKLLLDEDQLVRLSAFNFWTDKSHTFTSNTTIDRIVSILNKMYSPETEFEYLSYSTNLLLEKTSKSPDYNRLIFENPLSECSFKEYNLSTDWRRRHEMMTPQFMDTFVQSQSIDQITALTNSQSDMGMLKATQQSQAFNFTPTQNNPISSQKAAYNWLTQSSLETFSTTQNETQVAVYNKTTFKKSLIRSDEPEADIIRLRRRFRVVPKDKEEETKFFAKLQIDKQKREEETRKEEKLKKQGQVEKYRKYRIGDFPDIQIKYSEIIAPLQALAQRDSKIAMCLFNSLFSSIINEISYLKDEKESIEVMNKIRDSLNRMLNESEDTNATFVACLIEMAIKHSRSFQLECSWVASACLNSIQQPLGIVLIEEYLLVMEAHDKPPSTKRSKSSSGEAFNSETHLWIELAKLYRSINDYDSVKGIFTRNTSLITDHTREAFNYESDCDYFNASLCYKEALSEYSRGDVVLQIEKELWEQSLLRCLNELTDWKGISEMVFEKDSLNSLFEDSYKTEYLFPSAFHSKIQLILTETNLEDQQKHHDLVDFINKLSKDDKETIEASYSQDLAMFYLYQRDINACKYYAQLTLNKYLVDWSSLSKTTIQGRMAKLNSLQEAVELNEFLKFIDKTEKIVTLEQLETTVKHLKSQWLNSMPNDLSDPTQTWNNIITNRCVFFEYIEDENRNLLKNSKKIQEIIDKTKLEMKLKFSMAAHLQGNYKLAFDKLQQSRFILKNTSEDILYLKQIWMNVYLKTHLNNVQMRETHEKRLDSLLYASTLTKLNEYDTIAIKLEKTHSDLFQDHQIIKSKYCSFILNVILNHDERVKLINSIKDNNRTSNQFFSFIGTNQTDPLAITQALITQGFDCLIKTTINLKGNLELAKYCDEYLRMVENDNENSILTNVRFIKDKYPQVVISQLLSAIRLNSYEARQRFPRLLQIVEMYPELTIDLFIKESSDIPCWMFLGWLSQMTPLLDKTEYKAVKSIIENIAITYPQALIYPFKISSESFRFTSIEQKEYVANINRLMCRLPMVDHFINALEQLTNPDIACRDYLTTMFTNIKNRAIVSKAYQELRTNLIDLSAHDEASLANDTVFGRVKVNFSQKFKQLFDQELGKNDDLIKKLSDDELKSKIQRLSSKLSSFSSQTGNLGDYSNWLKNFKRNLTRDLEIPGQYTGKSKPLLEYHVKIESFDERMLVLNTLRKPKMIIIRGNDEKDHKFLVKSGEDQRQDQRIECLFELINDLLRNDPHCFQKNYSLRTYQVTPMTNKLAFIEWIDKTKTFKDALFSSLSDEENKRIRPNELKGGTIMAQLYQKYIMDAGRDPNAKFQDQYGSVYANYNRKHVETKFNEIKSYVPSDLFRRFLRSMALNTESYFLLRNHFIISYSVASICQYILGIGDRHLSNWMVDIKSGQAIGIDFGMAFGHATLQLPIPELIPLRLTDQLIEIMAPLGHHGLIEATMIHVLRALRKNNDLLLCTLNVFIKEPSLDWIGSAQRIANKKFQTGEVSSDERVNKNFAYNRINNVKAKLDGINPAIITKDDLAYGIHKDSKYLQHFTNIALGSNGTLRSKLAKERGEKYQLSYEEQVKCIIEQSTDVDILGRTWNGWEPYI